MPTTGLAPLMGTELGPGFRRLNRSSGCSPASRRDRAVSQ